MSKGYIEPFGLDLTRARRGQREFWALLFDRLQKGKRKTSATMPTGYGKAHAIRGAAVLAKNSGVIYTTLVLSPTEFLRDQMVSEKKLGEFFKLFKPRLRDGQTLRHWTIKHPEQNYGKNNEYMLSATIQLVENNLDHYVKWVESIYHRTGKSVLVVMDETHTNAHKNCWGEVLKRLKAAGAVLLVLTGTPFRDDGDELVGFNLIETDTEEIRVIKTRPGDTPDKIKVDIYDGMEYHFDIKADYGITYKAAWDEGVICHVNQHKVDVELSILEGMEKDTRMLSELCASEVRRVLGRVVRHPIVIRKMCKEMLDWLWRLRQAGGSKIAALIFCGQDTKHDQEDNEHILTVKKTIASLVAEHSHWKELNVVVATSANDQVGEERSGKKVLEDFVYLDVGDVLAAKQMAAMGLDADRLKIVVDLSPVRTRAAFVQRIMRACRIYDGMDQAHLISLADTLSVELFEKMIVSQGGEGSQKEIELTKSYQVPRKHREKPEYIINNTCDGGVQDTKKNRTLPERVNSILPLIQALPKILKLYTIAEIVNESEKSSFQFSDSKDEDPISIDDPIPVNGNKILEDIRRESREYSKSIVRLRMTRAGVRYDDGPEGKSFYRETTRLVWNEAYKRSNVPHNFDYKTTTDENLLRRFQKELMFMLETEMGEQ